MKPGSPRECDELFVRLLNDGDLDGLTALYAEGACHVREDGSLASGVDEIRQVLTAFLEMGPELSLEFCSAIPAGDDVAVLHDGWSMEATAPGVDQQVRGTSVHVVRRQDDGSWRFVVTGLANLGAESMG